MTNEKGFSRFSAWSSAACSRIHSSYCKKHSTPDLKTSTRSAVAGVAGNGKLEERPATEEERVPCTCIAGVVRMHDGANKRVEKAPVAGMKIDA